MASINSSKVPVPPGKAITASTVSIIFFFRSAISLTTIKSEIFLFAHSISTIKRGIMPTTLPSFDSAPSARAPIEPTAAPP